tara:strand:+ start:1213 stop:1473 length:261 start_codon:yes stop_codon:yes gene_type:complete
MSQQLDDLQIFISNCKIMDIEELESNIDEWEKSKISSTRLQKIDIAKRELELRYKERQDQIELLTKSLTSSSRLVRWISSFKAIFK